MALSLDSQRKAGSMAKTRIARKSVMQQSGKKELEQWQTILHRLLAALASRECLPFSSSASSLVALFLGHGGGCYRQYG